MNSKAKYPKRVLVYLNAFENNLTFPIIFTLDETLSHENDIVIGLPYALSQGKRLLPGNFIYHRGKATYRRLINIVGRAFSAFYK